MFDSRRPPLENAASPPPSSNASSPKPAPKSPTLNSPILHQLPPNTPSTPPSPSPPTTEQANLDTFVITGDIDAMWLRDSTQPRSGPISPLRQRTCAQTQSPSPRPSSAAKPNASSSTPTPTPSTRPTPSRRAPLICGNPTTPLMKPGVHEGKYETRLPRRRPSAFAARLLRSHPVTPTPSTKHFESSPSSSTPSSTNNSVPLLSNSFTPPSTTPSSAPDQNGPSKHPSPSKAWATFKTHRAWSRSPSPAPPTTQPSSNTSSPPTP